LDLYMFDFAYVMGAPTVRQGLHAAIVVVAAI
jgi:hypothetical protein